MSPVWNQPSVERRRGLVRPAEVARASRSARAPGFRRRRRSAVRRSAAAVRRCRSGSSRSGMTAEHRRRLGQAVAFEDRQAERRGTTGRASTPSGALPDTAKRSRPPMPSRIFWKTKPVGESRLQRQPRRQRPARRQHLAAARAPRDIAQSKIARLSPGVARPFVEDARVQLLEDPRHAGHDRRPHAQQIARDRCRSTPRRSSTTPLAQVDVGDDALERVTERQERQRHVVVAADRAPAETPSRLATRLPCVSITPFGSPVVPDV